MIVGRNADARLADYHPFRIFVCADMEARIDRCLARAEEGENLTRKQVKKNIVEIDKNRARNTALITGMTWGDREAYDLIVNTTDWEIKALTPAVADFAKHFFENRKG